MFHNDDYDLDDDYDDEGTHSIRELVSSIVLITWAIMAVITIFGAFFPQALHELGFLRAVIPGAWGN